MNVTKKEWIEVIEKLPPYFLVNDLVKNLGISYPRINMLLAEHRIPKQSLSNGAVIFDRDLVIKHLNTLPALIVVDKDRECKTCKNKFTGNRNAQYCSPECIIEANVTRSNGHIIPGSHEMMQFGEARFDAREVLYKKAFPAVDLTGKTVRATCSVKRCIAPECMKVMTHEETIEFAKERRKVALQKAFNDKRVGKRMQQVLKPFKEAVNDFKNYSLIKRVTESSLSKLPNELKVRVFQSMRTELIEQLSAQALSAQEISEAYVKNLIDVDELIKAFNR